MDRTEKEEMVSWLKQMFDESATIVVTHYSGLTVGEMTELRAKMREAGAGFKVSKNRLTRLALDGTAINDLSDMFKGPTGIAYSADPVAAAKVAVNFAKDNEKLVVLGGAFGEQLLDVAGINALAKLPSLDEIRGSLVGLLQAPATKVAGVLQAPAGQVARVIGAYASSEAA
ncbi:MAG: 50S ribosomal protein L10 [Proteobacteria bacterium]|nr:50S ribosomal protein L10 [Pseudomonadota bacterium]